jgi:hypothetical protein
MIIRLGLSPLTVRRPRTGAKDLETRLALGLTVDVVPGCTTLRTLETKLTDWTCGKTRL